MVTAQITTPASRRRPRAELYVATGGHAFLAFISIVGSFLFSFPLGGFLGWFTGIVLIAGGIGMIAAAYGLPGARPWAIVLGRRLMAAEFLWSFYKVVIYGEHESTLFLVVCLVAGLALWSPRVRAYLEVQR